MPTFRITSPDGQIFRITGPDGATEQDALAIVQGQYKPKFKSDSAPLDPGVPEWGRRMPGLYGLAGAARETLGPLAELGGLVGGAVAGVPAGPAGAVAGAGLGYGLGKQATRIADVALGNAKPLPLLPKNNGLLKDQSGIETEGSLALKNVGEGMAMEMGGQVLAPALGVVVKGAAKTAGLVADIANKPTMKAATIARESLGKDLPVARAALQTASPDLTAGQALAGRGVPTAQALLKMALERDPKFMLETLGAQEAARYTKLSEIANGQNQVAARQAREEMKSLLNKQLIPDLNVELNAANTAGQLGPKLSETADRFANAAASKVEDVRRFTASQDRPGPILSASAQPVPSKYTYLGGDLAKRAEEVATQAAEGSLRFGEASKFAIAALDSLSAHGLRPLKTDAVIGSIQSTLAKPEFAGNRDVQAVLGRVAEDIKQWTNSGGIIDAYALDSIRKNSVNSAIRALYPAAEAKAQKELAAKVLTNVKPVIIDAIEKAGGTGYRNYLAAYSDGMQQIGQTKMGAEAMRLYQSSPTKFVDLVDGNSPKVVEKIFGPGNYNLAKQMSADAMSRMKSVAGEVKRDKLITEQAKAGEVALREILSEHADKFRFPNFLNTTVSMTNRALDLLEKNLGKNVLNKLTEAAKSGQSFDDLLATMPAVERNKVLKTMSKPEEWMPNYSAAIKGVAPIVTVPSVNALAND